MNDAMYAFDPGDHQIPTIAGDGESDLVGRWIAHERDEALLFEAPVGGQCLRDSMLAHHDHGPTIGQTVTLIGSHLSGPDLRGSGRDARPDGSVIYASQPPAHDRRC